MMLDQKPKRRLVALAFGALALQVGALAGLAGVAAQPQAERRADPFPSDSGTILVTPVRQMSVAIETPDGLILTDPTGSRAAYSTFGKPAVILISHEHHEHFDTRTLAELVGPETRLVVPPYVMDRLPAELKFSAVSLANGDSSAVGSILVEAIPSYGMSGQAAQWHPRGRGNAYVVTVDGRRLYIGGSTEAVPEMLALRDVDIAFLPLYPPYALAPEQAVDAVSAMQPETVYVYQYSSIGTRDDFLRRVARSTMRTRIVAPDIAG